MSDFNLNIEALFRQAFGIAFNPPPPPTVAQLEGAIGYNQYKVEAQVNTAERDARKTWMGTPWMLPITFKGGTYQTYNEDGGIERTSVGDLTLPPATIADFMREKSLVETELPGGFGEVTELYGFRPWDVRIRGLALAEPGGFSARDYERALTGFSNLIMPVPVIGDDFFYKGIEEIIIKRILFRRLEGRPNVIPFEIEAKSATPLELQYS